MVASFERTTNENETCGKEKKTITTHIPSLPLSLPPASPPLSSSQLSNNSSNTNATIFSDVINWPKQDEDAHSKLSSFTFQRFFPLEQQQEEEGGNNNKGASNNDHLDNKKKSRDNLSPPAVLFRKDMSIRRGDFDSKQSCDTHSTSEVSWPSVEDGSSMASGSDDVNSADNFSYFSEDYDDDDQTTSEGLLQLISDIARRRSDGTATTTCSSASVNGSIAAATSAAVQPTQRRSVFPRGNWGRRFICCGSRTTTGTSTVRITPKMSY